MRAENVPDADDEEIDPSDCDVTDEERQAARERFKDATPLLKEIFSGSKSFICKNGHRIDVDYGFEDEGEEAPRDDEPAE